MRSPSGLLRLGAWLASTSLCLTGAAPAFAQPVAPAGVEQAGEDGSDPPAVAGRLAMVSGAVSFHAAGESQWNAATPNYPVTNGEAFWTEPQAAATLEIADDKLVMDDSTELDINTLDQAQFSATEAQGAIFLKLASLPSGQVISFNTPRGTVQISAIGRYEIVAGDTNDATTITVVEGAAHVSGNNLSLDIGPQQTATIGGSDTLEGSVGPMQQDPFLRAQLAADEQQAPRVQQAASVVPQSVRYMTGSSDLQQYGSFQQTSEYGQVWYPNDVARDWAPYRDGHWAYVQPWGWTWVDNARWGFAPFHYGRWVEVNDRWGWVAGEQAAYAGASPYPVYSPALVSFVDVGGAALAGAAIGFAAAELAGGYAPAWIPLGPREPYYPWYHCRPDYFARVNRPYGVPRTIIERGPTYINNINITNRTTNVFINRRAATVIPAAAFARGQSVMGVGRPLPERALIAARPVVGRLPVRPTAFTPNLPRAAAQRFNIAAPARPVRAAPGPRITPVAAGRPVPELRRAQLPGNIHAVPAAQVHGSAGAPGGAAGLRGPAGGPPLNTPNRQPNAGRPAGVAPGQPPAPGAQVSPHGPGGLPTLRAPGARPQAVPPGGATVPAPAHQPNGAPVRPGAQPGADRAAPGRTPLAPPAPRPDRTRPQAGLAETSRPGGLPAVPRPAPAVAPKPAPHVPAVRPEAPRAAPQTPASRPVPQSETPRPTPRVETPRPAPRVEAPRPAPRVEAPRPAPRVETPRPAPRAEAPRPAPAPRPLMAPRSAPAPRPMMAPRPAPAPRPMMAAPRPMAPPPRPAPAPAPHPAPRQGPGRPGQH